ncbi:Protein nedd1 [Rhizophlyctis rosea]|nr:Protein nedd1 [Rhizophlyctis rosea]
MYCTAGLDKVLKCHDILQNKVVQEFQAEAPLTCCTINDDHIIAAGTLHGSVIIYDVRWKGPVCTLDGADGKAINSIAFQPPKTPGDVTMQPDENPPAKPINRQENALRKLDKDPALDMFSPLAISKSTATSSTPHTPSPSGEVDNVLMTSPPGRSLRKTQTITSLMERFKAGAQRVPVKSDTTGEDVVGVGLKADTDSKPRGDRLDGRLGRMTSLGQLQSTALDGDDLFSDRRSSIGGKNLRPSRSFEPLAAKQDDANQRDKVVGDQKGGPGTYATIGASNDIGKAVRSRPSISSLFAKSKTPPDSIVSASPAYDFITAKSPVRSPTDALVQSIVEDTVRQPPSDLKERILENYTARPSMADESEAFGGMVGTNGIGHTSPLKSPPKSQPPKSPDKPSRLPVPSMSPPPIANDDVAPIENPATLGHNEPAHANIQYTLLENVIDECLQDFRMQMREDIQNMHLELLRQFQIQKNEIEELFQQYSPTAAMVAELNALREENARLRRNY